MTKDQIDELMRENGIVVVGEAVYVLCNLVEEQSAAAERERILDMCKEGLWDGEGIRFHLEKREQG